MNRNDLKKRVTLFRLDNLKSILVGSHKKMPWDAQAVGWTISLLASIEFLLGVVLLSGVEYMSKPDVRPVFFAIITLSTEISWGIYLVIVGLFKIIIGKGIRKGVRLAWWCFLIMLIDGTVNAFAILPRFKVSFLIGLAINLGTIVWLIYRRKLYTQTFDEN